MLEAAKAEEKKFLDDFANPILQLDAIKTILCIAHGENTVDKYPMRQNMRPSKYKLKDVVKDKVLYDFYISLGKEYKDKLAQTQALELLK